MKKVSLEGKPQADAGGPKRTGGRRPAPSSIAPVLLLPCSRSAALQQALFGQQRGPVCWPLQCLWRKGGGLLRGRGLAQATLCRGNSQPALAECLEVRHSRS